MIDIRVPESIRSRIMRGFIQHLKSNPVLSSVIKTWDDFSGRAEDHDIVPISKCPAIRFTYSGQGMSPETFTSSTANFSINMELIVPGSNQYQILDIWEVIETAADQFYGGDKAIRDCLQGDPRAIFGTHYLSSPAINHTKYKNPPCMVGNGSVSVVLSIRR